MAEYIQEYEEETYSEKDVQVMLKKLKNTYNEVKENHEISYVDEFGYKLRAWFTVTKIKIE